MDGFEAAWRGRFDRAARKYDTDHAVSGWSEEGLRRRLATFIPCFERWQRGIGGQHAGYAVNGRGQPSDAVPPFPRARAGRRILDLGCGAGTYSAWLAACGHRVMALDYSMETLRRAGRALRGQGVALVMGEAYHLPVATESVDAVVCIGVFQTLDHPRRCLAEIRRVLATGGPLFLMTLNARDVAGRVGRLVRRRRAGYEDLRRYDPDALGRWSDAAGLEVARMEPVYLMPDRAAALSRLIERFGIYRALGRLGRAGLVFAHAVLITARAV